MRTRSKMFTFAAALVGLLLIPTAAFAYAPTGDDFIECVAGDDPIVECTAGEFDPDSDADWEASYNPTIATGTATADDDGVVSFSFDASEVPDGSTITVEVTGTFDGETKTLADQIATVEDGEVIANAGSDAALLAMGAAGAIALGGAALFVSRRKRTTTAA